MGSLYGQGLYGQGLYGYAYTDLSGTLSLAGNLDVSLIPAGALNLVHKLRGNVDAAFGLAGALTGVKILSGNIDANVQPAATAQGLNVDYSLEGNITADVAPQISGLTNTYVLYGTLQISVEPQPSVLNYTAEMKGTLGVTATPAGKLTRVAGLRGNISISVTPRVSALYVGPLWEPQPGPGTSWTPINPGGNIGVNVSVGGGIWKPIPGSD